MIMTCWYSFVRFAESISNVRLVMIDKARRAKHVSSILLNKFCTTTIRKEKVHQKTLGSWLGDGF